MQSIDLMRDAFRHAADVGAYDRPAEHPCLGNDEAENLPPDRWNDGPVDPRHARLDLVEAVSAIERNDTAGRRQLLFRLLKRLDLAPHRGRRVMNAAAVDVDLKPGEAGLAQQIDR